MSDETPSEIIERAAVLLVESEIIAVEVNNPESNFRELWPVEAGPLVELLRASTGYWRLYEDRGWSDEKLRANVGSAACAALALAEKVLAVPAEVAEATAGRP